MGTGKYEFFSVMTSEEGYLDFMSLKGQDLSIQVVANGFEDCLIPWEIISDRDSNPMILAWYPNGDVEVAYAEID